MLTISAAADTVLRSWTMYTRVESWRGGQLLAADVPVSDGSHETDRTLQVPDRITLSVPRLDRGASWDPTDRADHPLACWGQRLRIAVGVGLAHGAVEWIDRGWYLITQASVDGDLVQVTALSLLQLIAEARLTAPVQPTGTIGAALRALCEPALTVDLRLAPADRAVPSGIAWDEDRIGAVFELLDAWPAEATVSTAGVLVVTAPVDDPAPVLDLSTAAGGTVVEVAGEVSRDGAASAVVARGTMTDGTTVQGVALDLSGGPTDISGPFNPLPVPYFESSPLLTTAGQCDAAAATILARRRRTAARYRTIEAVPHPALQAGDGVDTDDGPGVVETLTMPLTPGGGAMSAKVRING